jgi:hypothetical protein
VAGAWLTPGWLGLDAGEGADVAAGAAVGAAGAAVGATGAAFGAAGTAVGATGAAVGAAGGAAGAVVGPAAGAAHAVVEMVSPAIVISARRRLIAARRAKGGRVPSVMTFSIPYGKQQNPGAREPDGTPGSSGSGRRGEEESRQRSPNRAGHEQLID